MSVYFRVLISLFLLTFVSCYSFSKVKLDTAETVERQSEDLDAYFAQLEDELSNEELTGWLDEFSDEELHAYIDLVLESNPTLQQQFHQIDLNEAYRKKINSGLLPQVNLFGGVNSELFNIAGIGVGASWQADAWGTLQAQVVAADEYVLSAQYLYYYAREILISQVVSNWLNLSQAQDLLYIAQLNLDLVRESYGLIKDEVAIGKKKQSDLFLIKATLEKFESSLLEAEQDTKNAYYDFYALSGLTPAEEITVDIDFDHWSLSEDYFSFGLLARRYDVLGAKAKVMAHALNIKSSKLARLPTFDVGVNVGVDDTLSLVNSYNAQINQLLYGGGSISAGIDIAQQQYNIALLEFRQKIVSASYELLKYQNDIAFIAQEKQHLNLARIAYAETYELNNKEYQLGTISLQNLLQVQFDWLAIERLFVLKQYLEVESRVNFYVTLGRPALIFDDGLNITRE